MDKLYKKTNWVDNTEPDINAANLNKIENGIDGLDNRTIVMDGRIDQVNSDLTWVSLYSGDVTITDGTTITLTNATATFDSYKELLFTTGQGGAASWMRFYFAGTGGKLAVGDIITGTANVGNSLVPFSLRISSNRNLTALLGNNARIRSIYGR